MVRGISAGTIASQLGVHRNTIVGDIREIRKANAKMVEETDILEEVGEAAQFFDQVCKDAMFAVADNSHPMAKVSFMSIAMKARTDKLRLLTQIGVIPAVPRRERSAASVLFGDDVDLDKMEADELQRLKGQVLTELYHMEEIKKGEGEEEAIDVEVKVTDKAQSLAEDE